MRRFAVFIMALATIGFCAGEALAVERTLSKRYGRAELKSACESAGGHYGEGSAGYGCEKKCTSGGDYCTVTCSNKGGNCKGDTPGRVAPNANLSELLNGGKPAVLDPGKPAPSAKGAPGAAPRTGAVQK